MLPDRDTMIKIFSYYRDAEIRGASLLMKMMTRVKEPEAQVLFTRHIDDETRHAWLWTKRIRDEDAFPVPVPDGYQRRLGKVLGIPSSIYDLFALTVVVEERSAKRYAEHDRSDLCDPKTSKILRAITKDEKWHVNWMEEWLMKLAQENGRSRDDVNSLLAHYRSAEQEVFEEMKSMEREWLGFSFSDLESPQQSQSA